MIHMKEILLASPDNMVGNPFRLYQPPFYIDNHYGIPFNLITHNGQHRVPGHHHHHHRDVYRKSSAGKDLNSAEGIQEQMLENENIDVLIPARIILDQGGQCSQDIPETKMSEDNQKHVEVNSNRSMVDDSVNAQLGRPVVIVDPYGNPMTGFPYRSIGTNAGGLLGSMLPFMQSHLPGTPEKDKQTMAQAISPAAPLGQSPIIQYDPSQVIPNLPFQQQMLLSSPYFNPALTQSFGWRYLQRSLANQALLPESASYVPSNQVPTPHHPRKDPIIPQPYLLQQASSYPYRTDPILFTPNLQESWKGPIEPSMVTPPRLVRVHSHHTLRTPSPLQGRMDHQSHTFHYPTQPSQRPQPGILDANQYMDSIDQLLQPYIFN